MVPHLVAICQIYVASKKNLRRPLNKRLMSSVGSGKFFCIDFLLPKYFLVFWDFEFPLLRTEKRPKTQETKDKTRWPVLGTGGWFLVLGPGNQLGCSCSWFLASAGHDQIFSTPRAPSAHRPAWTFFWVLASIDSGQCPSFLFLVLVAPRPPLPLPPGLGHGPGSPPPTRLSGSGSAVGHLNPGISQSPDRRWLCVVHVVHTHTHTDTQQLIARPRPKCAVENALHVALLCPAPATTAHQHGTLAASCSSVHSSGLTALVRTARQPATRPLLFSRSLY
jgi:hypothetical protein